MVWISKKCGSNKSNVVIVFFYQSLFFFGIQTIVSKKNRPPPFGFKVKVRVRVKIMVGSNFRGGQLS